MLANIMEGFLFGHGPTIVQYHVPFFIVSSWIPASIASTNFCEDSIVSGFRVEDDLIVMVWLCLQFYAGRRCSTGFAESEPNYMGRKVVLCYLWINLAWNMGVQKILGYLGCREFFVFSPRNFSLFQTEKLRDKK
jgi:hypothetical protein